MKREEKINTLRTIIQECEEYQWQRKETLFEIIKDLDQEPVLDRIRAEIEQFAKNPNFGDLSTGVSCGALKAIEIIDKYKAEGNEK